VTIMPKARDLSVGDVFSLHVPVKRALQDRYTVLHHDPKRQTLKGHVTESWLCVDCGFNTAPKMMDRKQLELASALTPEADGGVEMAVTSDSEVYTVTDEVWKLTGLEAWGGCLCIGCLEKRIGRRLKPDDFPPDHAFNDRTNPASKRLRKRRGARADRHAKRRGDVTCPRRSLKPSLPRSCKG
jgi:hypothetical protein